MHYVFKHGDIRWKRTTQYVADNNTSRGLSCRVGGKVHLWEVELHSLHVWMYTVHDLVHSIQPYRAQELTCSEVIFRWSVLLPLWRNHPGIQLISQHKHASARLTCVNGWVFRESCLRLPSCYWSWINNQSRPFGHRSKQLCCVLSRGISVSLSRSWSCRAWREKTSELTKVYSSTNLLFRILIDMLQICSDGCRLKSKTQSEPSPCPPWAHISE